MKEKKRVFCSWSGGKDSSLACYKAMLDGFEVSHLLNFLAEEGKSAWNSSFSPEASIRSNRDTNGPGKRFMGGL